MPRQDAAQEHEAQHFYWGNANTYINSVPQEEPLPSEPEGVEPEEPQPTDQAPATPLPAPSRESTIIPSDAMVIVQYSPQDIQRLRPRWSLERCRGWLIASAPAFREYLGGRGRQWVMDSLHNTAPRLQMDESPGTATATRIAGVLRHSSSPRRGIGGTAVFQEPLFGNAPPPPRNREGG